MNSTARARRVIVRVMSARCAWMLGGFALLGCRDDKGLLSLDELCPTLAADICEARDGCCNQPDVAACVSAEKARCDALLAGFAAEPLTYDASNAAWQRAIARGRVDLCEATPSLAPFFEGGLALGQACERDPQCASGRCAGEPLACSEPTLAPLCPQ